jgi:hypothetical protein
MMANPFKTTEATGDFDKARNKEVLSRMIGLLSRQRQDLLSFEEVKSILRPKTQSYKGLQVVPINLIIGSEGRYQDFSKHFLPKKEYLRNRWTSVDFARLTDTPLPAIQLYELGSVYFVRDGNHRVSVARSQGIESIDADVTVLNSEITITADMTQEDLKAAVINYERQIFMEKTNFAQLFPDYNLALTTTGQYDEILYHIMVHKYFINQDFEAELPLEEAVKSWFITVYQPICEIVMNNHMVDRFPGRTDSDLYVWIVKHWHYLKEKYGENITAKDAAESYSRIYGISAWRRFITWGKSFMQRFK